MHIMLGILVYGILETAVIKRNMVIWMKSSEALFKLNFR